MGEPNTYVIFDFVSGGFSDTCRQLSSKPIVRCTAPHVAPTKYTPFEDKCCQGKCSQALSATGSTDVAVIYLGHRGFPCQKNKNTQSHGVWRCDRATLCYAVLRCARFSNVLDTSAQRMQKRYCKTIAVGDGVVRYITHMVFS